ncbi:hypothetical protein HA402_011684 [Bradysia odoriphaga]|nr:hypothetical protein HA402_011684 [Bradysia odoriphaga]
MNQNQNHNNADGNNNQRLWHTPQPGPSTPPRLELLEPITYPPSPEIRSMVESMLTKLKSALTIQNADRTETLTRYDSMSVQVGQNNPRLVEERAAVQVNQEGQVNGQNVQSAQTFRIRVRRDLFPDSSCAKENQQ